MDNKFIFEIKRLVLVDSAGFCYVELPVDQHAILLGEGNLGKSSLLNSLRLFLLPENNFKKSHTKFAFRTPKKDGYYSNDESYQHYFPGKHSFLILEASNNIGGKVNTHCQILYRAKNLGYHRVFVPLKYQQIRHVFWNGSGDKDGIGQAVHGLSAAAMIEQVKALSRDTQLVSEPAKLKQLLYANDLLSAKAMQFSVFPLAESDLARIESLRTLILLLFDMNTSSSPVATAVASIIEADKKHADDALDFDIDGFLAKHNDLKRQDETLTQIENLRPVFVQLEKNMMECARLGKAERDFGNFIREFEQNFHKQSQLKKQHADKFGELKQSFTRQKKAFNTVTNELTRLQGQVRGKQKDFNQENHRLEQACHLMARYPGKSDAELLNWLESDLTEEEKQLDALSNEEKAAARKQELQQRVRKQQQQLADAELGLANQQYSIHRQLAPQTWTALAAINKNLVLANPGRGLSEVEKQGLADFAALLTDEGDWFQFFDREFVKQSQLVERDLAAEIQHLEGEINSDKKALAKLQGNTNPLVRQQEIQTLEKQHKETRRELEIIKRYPVAQTRVPEIKQELAELTRQEDELSLDCGVKKAAFEQLEQALVQMKALRDEADRTLEQLISLQQDCNHLRTRHPRLGHMLPGDGQVKSGIEVSKAALLDIDQQLTRQDQLREKLIYELRGFIREKLIDDDNQLFTEAPTLGQVRHSFERLADVYRELPQRRAILAEQIKTHNGSVLSYSQVLTANFEHIERFQQQLNREFELISINDLQGIQVAIHMDQRFRNLINEIAKVDLLATDLVADQFYDRLAVFAKTFFSDSQDKKLTMVRIVTSLSYQTRKAGEESWQTKQQSNSTTALINLELVQILLGKVLRSSCRVIFPLVLDEVATVDVGQFDWLLPHLASRGFNLFAASTYSASTELVQKIGNYHEIGAMRTNKPYSEKRTAVYWGGAEQMGELDKIELDNIPLNQTDWLAETDE